MKHCPYFYLSKKHEVLYIECIVPHRPWWTGPTAAGARLGSARALQSVPFVSLETTDGNTIRRRSCPT